MFVRRRYQVGRYVTDERSMVMTSSTYAGGGPVVLVCPGVAADGWEYRPGLAGSHPNWWDSLSLLAQAGAVVAVGTFADTPDGGSSWGNQPGRDRMDLMLDSLADDPDLTADITRVGILGDSEGGVQGLNYLWRHTDTVKALVTRLTPLYVQSLYEVNSIVESTVDAAFDTLGGWATNQPTHDPGHPNNVALITPIADRVRSYYSTDDGLAPAADHTTYQAATGIEIVSLGPVAHDIRTTGPVHPQHMASFILDRLAA